VQLNIKKYGYLGSLSLSPYLVEKSIVLTFVNAKHLLFYLAEESRFYSKSNNKINMYVWNL
jgi:hypothetical protein